MTIEEQLKNYKTTCCNSDFYRKDRADFRCSKCDKDITLEVILFYKAITNE